MIIVSESIDLDDAKEASNGSNTGVSTLLQALARPIPGMASVQFVLGNTRGDNENGTASDFQLNTCTVHKSGALVMESTQSNKDLFDATAQNALLPLMSAIDLPQQPGPGSLAAYSATPSRRVSFVGSGTSSTSKEGSTATPLKGDIGGPAGDSDSESDNDGICAGMAAGAAVSTPPGTKGGAGTPGFSMTLRRRSMSNSLTIHSEGGLYGDEDDIVIEEWALLDPHTCTVALHPFKKAKTYKTLDELKAAEAAAQRRAERFNSNNSDGGSGDNNGRQEGGFRVRAPFFEEFDYLYDREMRRRRSALAQRRREQLQPIALLDGAESDPIKILAREAAVIAQPQAINALIGEDPYEVAALPPPQQEQQGQQQDAEEDGGLNDYDGGMGPAGISDTDSSDEEERGGSDEEMGLDSQAQGYYSAVLSSRNEEFYSDRYRREMELNARISMWRAKLDPMLEEQQRRKGYNIQECATDILRKLEEKTAESGGEDVGFADIVAGKEPWEVSRFFLASLLLVNCGNIAVNRQDPLEFSVKTTALSFSAVQNYERLSQEGQVQQGGAGEPEEGGNSGGSGGKRRKKNRAHDETTEALASEQMEGMEADDQPPAAKKAKRGRKK